MNKKVIGRNWLLGAPNYDYKLIGSFKLLELLMAHHQASKFQKGNPARLTELKGQINKIQDNNIVFKVYNPITPQEMREVLVDESKIYTL